MIDAINNDIKLDAETLKQVEILKLKKGIADLHKEIEILSEVVDERILVANDNLKRDLKDFIKANIVAVKEDSKPKGFWNFINPFK